MVSKGAVVVLCLAAVCVQFAQCKHWALLVAGSNGYYNYRHQADICHAYHIMRNHGIPKENIVTMMYDDIAYNEENPFQGNIINQPNGTNVYPGVVIDYKKENVNPEVFLAVLSGDEAKVKKLTGKTGKVIKSGPEDHVFVNFADHGAPGLLAFPVKVLHAKQLEKTIKKMYTKKSYKKMVFYVEACESGSMFASILPKDINVFATTAANPDQSSYACYFDEKRNTYLGDVYSVMWMQDSDKENLKKETLQKQYQITKKETNTSQVMEYGDMSISKMTVAEFQGNQAASVSMTTGVPPHPTADAVPAPDVAMSILRHKLANARTLQEKRRISQEITDLMEHESQIDALFRDILVEVEENALESDEKGSVLKFNSELGYKTLKQERLPLTRWTCYEEAVDALQFFCPKMKLPQEYRALKQLYLLVNLCERGHNSKTVALGVLTSAYKHSALCH